MLTSMHVFFFFFSVKYLNPHTHIVLIRANRGMQHIVITSAVFITKIGDAEVMFRSLGQNGNPAVGVCNCVFTSVRSVFISSVSLQ